MTLLSLLFNERVAGRWRVVDSTNDVSVLSIVRFNAILHHGSSFNFPEELYQSKLLEWLRRFHLFHWLLSCPLIHYDENLHRLSSSRLTWINLSHISPEALWYSHEDEFGWSYLYHLFPLNPLPFWLPLSPCSSLESHASNP